MLTPDTLDEYLDAYRQRTQWLCERFPGNMAAWQYFEWSFMISMVEKVHRHRLKGFERQLHRIMRVLFANYDEFYMGESTQDFEREWLKRYVDLAENISAL